MFKFKHTLKIFTENCNACMTGEEKIIHKNSPFNVYLRGRLGLEGYTLQAGRGCYGGVHENSLTLTIWDSGNLPQLLQTAELICGYLHSVYKQESVGVIIDDSMPILIYADDLQVKDTEGEPTSALFAEFKEQIEAEKREDTEGEGYLEFLMSEIKRVTNKN